VITRRGARLVTMASLAVMAAASVAVGTLAAGWIEKRTLRDVAARVGSDKGEWLSLEADGLRLTLSGIAPDEAARFKVLSRAGEVIDAARIVDRLDVREAAALEPLRFGLEILRNEDAISLIGLVPTGMRDEALQPALDRLGQSALVTDMLDEAEEEVPATWEAALDYGLVALAALPHSKISVAPEKVQVTAIARTLEEKNRAEALLARNRPEGVLVEISISAPRPVISPFRFEATRIGDRLTIGPCAVSTETERARLRAAAARAGLQGGFDCAVGLGAPSPRWLSVVERSLVFLVEIGEGNVTMRDADISVEAGPDVAQVPFNRALRSLGMDMPQLFTLTGSLPERRGTEGLVTGTGAEFAATLAPDGLVQLRGAVADARARAAVGTYAVALFGEDRVFNALRVEPDLPDGWPQMVLAGLEALGTLHSGNLQLAPDRLVLSGASAEDTIPDAIANRLRDRLGEDVTLALNVVYDESLDPRASMPTPVECMARIAGAVAERKITFAPGASTIDAQNAPIMDALAEILRECPEMPLEIAGYTDSQGRESMNLTLSQSRAQAVLDALLARRIITSKMVARGYGQADPIASNATEEGREANRRIEFRLIEAGAEEVSEDEAEVDEEEGAESPVQPDEDLQDDIEGEGDGPN